MAARSITLGIQAALAEYVSFGPPHSPEIFVAATSPPEPADARPGRGGPRNGMLLQEADELFGEPVESTEHREGKLRVVVRTYATPDGRVTAEFVEGVLFRYAMTSN